MKTHSGVDIYGDFPGKISGIVMLEWDFCLTLMSQDSPDDDRGHTGIREDGLHLVDLAAVAQCLCVSLSNLRYFCGFSDAAPSIITQIII